ncbi:WxcM-like domain-containing protein [Pseudoalteromonas sp. SR44-8]|uniref:sugar 3,4-ketoisomerase n=1 Tax=Pseudoalteromonas sp. SR44-8 TaxID=2760933 RepID=UPI0016008B0B|nr:FdtA/QdtA family cupin domain-containing protein [Pseudoalteromonas sp. SR44-8]MBB1303738.1 WxcM-like domain-containing protein [Pseudoalteromonas sp. SR44-8]
MSLIKLLNFQNLGDERGDLISLEQQKNIPFDVKRVYYLFNTGASVARGFHAHINLEQVAICVKGSCRFILDNGEYRESVILNSPDLGLYIGNHQWREMHDFSSDCVLLILASEYYCESDYIRNYQEFIALVNK